MPNASRFLLAGFMQFGAILFTYITYLIKNIVATQEQQSLVGLWEGVI